jgi:hypothetical protein
MERIAQLVIVPVVQKPECGERVPCWASEVNAVMAPELARREIPDLIVMCELFASPGQFRLQASCQSILESNLPPLLMQHCGAGETVRKRFFSEIKAGLGVSKSRDTAWPRPARSIYRAENSHAPHHLYPPSSSLITLHSAATAPPLQAWQLVHP